MAKEPTPIRRAPRRQYLAADPDAPTSVDVPIDFSGSSTAILVRGVIFQLILVVGALIGVLGLAEDSWVSKLYRFARSAEAIPIITLISGLAASVYMLFRRIVEHRKGQTLSLLPSMPDSVAIGPKNPPAAVLDAVAVAETKIQEERSGQRPAGLSGL